ANLAVWFRKFSDPKLSHMQVIKVPTIIDDALMLNVHRFTTQGIVTNIKIQDHYTPSVLTNPIDFILWINTAFSELVPIVPSSLTLIEVSCTGDYEYVTISIGANIDAGAKDKIASQTLEKFANKMSGNAKFDALIKDDFAEFKLTLRCVSEHTDETSEQGKLKQGVLGRVAEVQAKEKINTPLVLIVDDEKDIRRLVKRALKQANIECLEAHDGVDALEYFANEENKELASRIHVVVSDVRMPRMTGPHLLIALRDRQVSMPFIFFSSNLIEKKRGDFEYENVYYLTKDEGLDKLKKVIQDLLK
ncbi:MAG: response regulator, partial [Silvanigrellaceae bacterium]|nr:response regulator [Silvanigrellaceae bacterium]